MPVPGVSLEEAVLHPELLQFTFLLISSGDFPLFRGSHRIISKIEGFSHLLIDWRMFPPLKIVLREAVFVVVRNITTTCKTDYEST